MDVVTYVLIGIAIYICIYAIIDRICRCKEQCEAFRTYGVYFSAMGNKPEDLKANMSEVVNALKNSMDDK